MMNVRRAIVIGTVFAGLCGCGLVLDDPRPYPAPSPDSAVVNQDAGMGMTKQALRVHPPTGNRWADSRAERQRPLVDQRYEDDQADRDWWCPVMEINETDICRFLEFVIEL